MGFIHGPPVNLPEIQKKTMLLCESVVQVNGMTTNVKVYDVVLST
jgi:hypothetical protein